MNALLNALAGGYEVEVRLEIVEGLVGKVDVGMHSLVVLHLEDIRAEAEAFGKEDLARKADDLLKLFTPDQE